METQDASAEFIIKFWPWLEANRQRLIISGVAAVAILFIWYFIATQREQRAIAAGQAFALAQINLPQNPSAQQVADTYLKIATDYAGTLTAERAQLQAASVLFSAGRYDDALAQFQKLSANDSASPLVPAAHLGAGASRETGRGSNGISRSGFGLSQCSGGAAGEVCAGPRAGSAGQAGGCRELLSGSSAFATGRVIRPGSCATRGADSSQACGHKARRQTLI